MRRLRMRVAVPLLALTALTLYGLPAFAQVDFSGEWSPRFYEDAPERGPGPNWPTIWESQSTMRPG